jgi:polyisoprenoid-binding protein YceI
MKLATRLFAALVALAATASFAAAAPTTWNIDASHTEVGFDVRHFFSKVHGRFHDVAGTIVFDEADANAIKVDATVKVSSVDTGNEKRDGHLQSPDFFNAATDSIISFKSTKVTKAGKGKYKVEGDFTLRGVTKKVVFDGEFLGAGDISVDKNSWGGKAGFAATTVINRKDYGVNWNKTLDNGGLMVDDMVTITLNIEANKAK